MEGYGPRIYREAMGGDRFASITVSVDQTDLWIGIDAGPSVTWMPGNLNA